MEFEHFAINVPDSAAQAQWYVDHCGMKIVMAVEGPPHMRFLADETGKVIMEMYSNENDPMPDYTQQHPLRFHHAYAVEDPDAERKRLEAAGATFVEEVRPGPGTQLVMMRDPWGVPIQLCKRAKPFD